MANPVNFLDIPCVTAIGQGPSNQEPVAYYVNTNLSFSSGEYEQQGVSVTYIDEERVVIQLNVQLNVNAVQGSGPSTMNFRDDFSHVCLQQLQIEIVVHDGTTELGRKGGTHDEDCEEVLRPVSKPFSEL